MIRFNRRAAGSKNWLAAAAVGALLAAPACAQDAAATEPAEASAPASPDADAASEPVDAEAAVVTFVQTLIDDAAAALTAEESTDEERLKGFQTVLGDGLALKTLAKFMVGRSVYDSMDEAQKARYDAIFPDYITKQYAEQFDGILGQPLEVTETTPFRKDIFVRTKFIRDEGQPINVDWRARSLKSGGHKLIDIVVNGASIMSVKKSEFAGFIEKNGVDALLSRLESEAAGA